MLSLAFANEGIDVKSYECYPKEGYRMEYDMGLAKVIDAEIAAANNNEILGAHFGIVCSSWSILNRLLNGGTRTREAPRGDGSLARERTGNQQATQMFRLIKEFDRLGIPYSVENPESSALWWLPQWKNVPFGVCDQCMLGLKPPEKELHRTHRVKKKTRFCGTVAGIEDFSKHKCDRSHEHSIVIGSVVVDGKRINRSTAAGAYPKQLGIVLAQMFAQHFRELLRPRHLFVRRIER
jgi:hypothetical protein